MRTVFALVAALTNAAFIILFGTLIVSGLIIKACQAVFGPDWHGLVVLPTFVLFTFLGFYFSRFVYRGIKGEYPEAGPSRNGATTDSSLTGGPK